MSAASRRSLLLAAGMLAAASVVGAQEIEVSSDPEPDGRWGTGSSAVKAIPAMAFQEAFQGGAAPGPQLFSFTTGFRRHLIAGSTATAFYAALDLPAGAQLMGITLEACDTNNPGEARFALWLLPTSNQATSTGFSVGTGTTAVPGCTIVGNATNLAGLNLFVDNVANTYLATVTLGSEDTTTSFRSVRVFYRLRVSPAPVTARFTDVPTTHIFFQWIEALAASGITSGCTSVPGGFCPNDPVTRGQMAVFLATALGLHFPN